jgi:phospholipase C
LYEPGEVDSFEGVAGKELSNPIPAWAEHGADRKEVPYGISPTMNTPWPDPGEELPHINTQLFGILDEGNRAVLQPKGTFNAPDPPSSLIGGEDLLARLYNAIRSSSSPTGSN